MSCFSANGDLRGGAVGLREETLRFPGCVFRYICKFVATCLDWKNPNRMGLSAPRYASELVMQTSPPLTAQQLAAFSSFAQTLADQVRPLSRQWFRHP